MFTKKTNSDVAVVASVKRKQTEVRKVTVTEEAAGEPSLQVEIFFV